MCKNTQNRHFLRRQFLKLHCEVRLNCIHRDGTPLPIKRSVIQRKLCLSEDKLSRTILTCGLTKKQKIRSCLMTSYLMTSCSTTSYFATSVSHRHHKMSTLGFAETKCCSFRIETAKSEICVALLANDNQHLV